MFLKSLVAVALVAVAFAAPVQAAQINLPGLGTLGIIGSAGFVGGLSGSQAESGGSATGWKSQELNSGNSTLSAKFDSYGLAESSIGGAAGAGLPNAQNGFTATLNVGSGALAATSGSLTQPGSLSAGASSHGSSGTISLGGGAGVSLQ